MGSCPKCGTALSRCSRDRGFSWRCGSCHGEFLSQALLRRVGLKDLATRLHYRGSRASKSSLSCASCGLHLSGVADPLYDSELGVCRPCGWVWFPAGFENSVEQQVILSSAHHSTQPVVTGALKEIHRAAVKDTVKRVSNRHKSEHHWAYQALTELSYAPTRHFEWARVIAVVAVGALAFGLLVAIRPLLH